jgi:hypothetical protein
VSGECPHLPANRLGGALAFSSVTDAWADTLHQLPIITPVPLTWLVPLDPGGDRHALAQRTHTPLGEVVFFRNSCRVPRRFGRFNSRANARHPGPTSPGPARRDTPPVRAMVSGGVALRLAVAESHSARFFAGSAALAASCRAVGRPLHASRDWRFRSTNHAEKGGAHEMVQWRGDIVPLAPPKAPPTVRRRARRGFESLERWLFRRPSSTSGGPCDQPDAGA